MPLNADVSPFTASLITAEEEDLPSSEVDCMQKEEGCCAGVGWSGSLWPGVPCVRACVADD